MKLKHFLLLAIALMAGYVIADEAVTRGSDGLHIASNITDRIGLYGVTPVAQRSGANQTALTDNTGGSVANATLADGLTVTALTDSSGGATANGTIEAVTAPSAVTDSTGGTPGTTLAAITSPTAVTNSSGGSTADTIIAAITEAGTAGSADITPTKDAIAKLAVLGNANAAAVILLKDDIASLAARQAENRAAIALTDAVKELSTKLNLLITDDSTQNDNDAKLAELVNELRAALVALGPIAGS